MHLSICPNPLGFPSGSYGKESTCNARDLGLIPGLGRSPGGGHDNSLQYSCLENPHGEKTLVSYSPWGHKELDMTEWLSTAQCIWAYQVVLVVKNPPANSGDIRNQGLILVYIRSPGEGHGNPLQYSFLENPMDRGVWQATVRRVTKSQTWLKLPSMHACIHSP